MRFLLPLIAIMMMSASANAADVKSYPVTADDRLALARVEKYLSAVSTISAEFIQTAPSGDVSTGTFQLKRPGKLRMEYNPPTPVLMVANGGDIVYYDKELDQVTHIPMGSTLVGFLARPEVKFDDSVVITNFDRGDKTLAISLVQSDKSKNGTLTLEFTDFPLILRKMVVTDASGQKTFVALNNARFNTPLEDKIFVFKDPHIGKNSGFNERPMIR